MSILFSNFNFLRPAWLLLLLTLPLLWRALKTAGNDAQAWRGAVDAHLLEHLIVRNDAAAPARSPVWLAVAALALASLALAGPAWERLPQPLYKNQAARVIALELSNTMLAQDVKPSRYARARYKIADILERSGDAQVALIAYAGDAFVVAPLTDDANTVASLVDSLDPSVMPAPGNDTGKAIDLGVKLIRQAGVREGEIVLLADGAGADADAAVARARSAGVRVSVLGIGSARGAPVPVGGDALGEGGFLKDKSGNIVLPKLDGAALAALAQAGGGRYAEYRGDAGDLEAILDRLAQGGEAAKDASGNEVQSERFLDRGPWLLLALLPLAALGFRRGWLLLLPFALLASPHRAEASVWTDLWQRADQQAQAQLDAGKPKEAQALAKNPELRGTAAYRAGDYAAAMNDFAAAAAAQKESADAQYNRGNALAKQGKFEEAIAAYDDALRRAPGMADAIANKKAVEDFLKKKQQQDRQPKDQQDHQGNKQQQPGNDQPQDSRDSKDGKGDQQGDSGGEKKESKDRGKDESGGSDQDGKPQDSQKQNESARSQDKPGAEKNAAQPPGQGGEAGKESQEKFRQGIDKALDGKTADGKKPQPVRLGAREGEARSEKDQAVEQWLQRVPDDPGGLLRRKFLLEHQRRRQGAAQEDSQ
ncbi:MAG: VWA domain-containing protein [Rudaea sp.]|uniref:VWA domain-containing protein n=1 Tax=Rudaea sp. TaxID=2136325 RepID=UPI0039E40506